MKKAKQVLQILSVCLFSLSLFFAIMSFAVSDLVAPLVTGDVISQATVYYGDEIVKINIKSINLINNIFFLSLAGLGFSLLLLFYLEGNFSAFFAPAICNFVIVIILQIFFTILPGLITAVLDDHLDMIQFALNKGQLATLVALLIGIILFVFSLKLKSWPVKSKYSVFKP